MVVDIESLKLIQQSIAERVSLVNELPSLQTIETVAGADISCGRFSKRGFAAIVVLTYPACEILETARAVDSLTIPYIPGYLAFREWPLIEQCIGLLQTKPDVLICDGQGIAHPRKAGLASHVGVLSGWITVGCAKNRLVGEHEILGAQKNSKVDLFYQAEKIGEVVRTRANVKPLYISPGHRIDFHHATELIVSLCGRYRQPEPIRKAHQLVNQMRIRAAEK